MGRIDLDIAGSDGPWPELNDENTTDLSQSPLGLAWIPKGADNVPVLAMKLQLKDGSYIYWDTHLADFIEAAKALNDKAQPYLPKENVNAAPKRSF